MRKKTREEEAVLQAKERCIGLLRVSNCSAIFAHLGKKMTFMLNFFFYNYPYFLLTMYNYINPFIIILCFYEHFLKNILTFTTDKTKTYYYRCLKEET